MEAVTFRRTGFQPVQPGERVENSFYVSALEGAKAGGAAHVSHRDGDVTILTPHALFTRVADSAQVS